MTEQRACHYANKLQLIFPSIHLITDCAYYQNNYQMFWGGESYFFPMRIYEVVKLDFFGVITVYFIKMFTR